MSNDGKKKLNVVKKRPGTREGSYTMTAMGFSLVSSPENGRVQSVPLCTCRESLNYHVREAIVSSDMRGRDETSYFRPGFDVVFDTKRLRLLIVKDPQRSGETVDDVKARVFNGKAALNLIENSMKWPVSKIATVKHEKYKNAWLITGPDVWLTHPQMLSLATWIVRVPALHQKIINVENLDTYFKEVVNLDTHAVGIVGKLPILLENIDHVFGKYTEKDVWANIESSIFSSNSGISSFLNGAAKYSSYIKEVTQRFVKVYAKATTKSTTT